LFCSALDISGYQTCRSKELADKKFKEIQEAYDVLSDPAKRDAYDAYGEGGVKGQAQGSEQDHEYEEFETSFAEFGRRFRHSFSSPMNFQFKHPWNVKRLVERKLVVTLEELFHGGKRMEKTSVYHLDPGTGFAVPVDKTFTIDIKRGWKEGTRITFEDDEGLQSVCFVLKEKSHEFFKRIENDLIYVCELSKKEAKEGVNVTIPTIDGEGVRLRIRPNSKMVNIEKQKVIENKGMYVKGGMNRGKLIVKFKVRGWFARKVVKPCAQAAGKVVRFAAAGGICFLVLRHPLRILRLLWILSTQLLLISSLLNLYT